MNDPEYEPKWGVGSDEPAVVVAANVVVVSNVVEVSATAIERELAHISEGSWPSIEDLCSIALNSIQNDANSIELNVLMIVLLHAMDNAVGVMRDRSSTARQGAKAAVAVSEIVSAIDLKSRLGAAASTVRREIGANGGMAQAARFIPIQNYALERAQMNNYKSRRNAAISIKKDVLEYAKSYGIILSEDQAATTIAGWLKDKGYAPSTG